MLNAESPETKLGYDANPLTGDQLAEFRREGFLAVNAPQISQSDIVWCRNILMSLFERGAGRKEGRNLDISAREGGDDGVTPSLSRASLYASELRKWSYRKTGLAIAKQLLGPEATLSADNAFFKPSRVGGPTPWHQDEAYNDPRHYQEQVTIWIAIFDTTIENGAMAFIPRSHLMGILPHRPNCGAKEANSIECCEGFDPRDARICPIRAGGITIHQGRTLHGASVNKSDTPRLGYVLNYKTPPKSRTDLGTFSWNNEVGRTIHRRRKYWLLRGGIFVEVWRFLRSDRDNLRHFFMQVAKYFKG
jgi:hypothetical protein